MRFSFAFPTLTKPHCRWVSRRGGPSAPGPSELMLRGCSLNLAHKLRVSSLWMWHRHVSCLDVLAECLPGIQAQKINTQSHKLTQIQKLFFFFFNWFFFIMKTAYWVHIYSFILNILTLDIYCLQVLLGSAYLWVQKLRRAVRSSDCGQN